MPRDRFLLLAGAFVRAVAIAFVAVLLGVHLAARGLEPRAIGNVVGAGLAGAGASALLITVVGDRLRRRTWLVLLSGLAAAGGLAVALASGAWVLGAAAFLGMVNGMGRDRGGAAVLDQAALPATTDDAGRTRAFALYALAQDIGHALGALLAGVPALLADEGLADLDTALIAAMIVHAAMHGALALAYAGLSPAVDAPAAAPTALAPATRRTVVRISGLFLLDALGGGFLSSALLTLFFVERFEVSPAAVAALFAGARVLNALSHLLAAWLARKIGLVATMVFTHLPSSLLLVTVAFAPSFWIAALLFLLREGLVEMDVPTRQSFVMAVVAPAERTRVAGITQLVRLAGWAAGPFVAGAFLADDDRIMVPLIVGAALKIVYDLLLWAAFRSVRIG